MHNIKCLIIDDEKLARELLFEYLQEYDNVEVIGQCAKGTDAVKVIDEEEPDLIFLDVQMPGINGFEVLEKIKSTPFVIFCTAYDQYAIKAFDNNAIDYLLKPLDKARFDLAVTKAIERIGKEDKNFEHILSEFVKKENSSYSTHLFVQKSEKLLNLPVQNIIHLEASGDYSIISTKSDQFLSSTGISKIEDRLDPDVFIRIHRSTIINLDRLVEIEKLFNGNLVVKMENNKTFPISRTYAKKIKGRMI